MTWFKVDDSFYDHLKVFDAPDCAVALWLRAGAWAARNLTDGFVPSGMPARLCDDADTAVKELVRRKLWLRVKDGFRFHDWTKYQPTRESVEHDREQATERKRRERERRRNGKAQVSEGGVTDESRRDTTGTTGVTHGPVTAPRPDPARPSLPTEEKPLAADAANDGQQSFAGMPEPRAVEKPIKANDIVAAFLDAAKEAGRVVDADVRGQVASKAKRILEKNPEIPAQRVLRAAQEMGRNGYKDLSAQLLRGSAPENGAGYRNGKHETFKNPTTEGAYEGVL